MREVRYILFVGGKKGKSIIILDFPSDIGSVKVKTLVLLEGVA
jgi:hypothetical protein